MSVYVSPTIPLHWVCHSYQGHRSPLPVGDNSWVDWEIIEGYVAKTYGGMEWQFFFLEVVKIFWKVWW